MNAQDAYANWKQKNIARRDNPRAEKLVAETSSGRREREDNPLPDEVKTMKKCANCGNPIRLSDRRYKYCSDECYVEARRRQCRENFRRRYANAKTHAQELERYRRYYAENKEKERG